MSEFKVMLPAPAPQNLEGIQWPVYMHPYYGGVRATVQKGRLVSRSGNEFANAFIQELFSRPELEGADGELIIVKSSYKDDVEAHRQTREALGNIDGEPAIAFMVADCVAIKDAKYIRRWDYTRMIVNRLISAEDSGSRLVPQLGTVHMLRANRRLEFLDYADRLYNDFPGVMIRSIEGKYQGGVCRPHGNKMMLWKRVPNPI